MADARADLDLLTGAARDAGHLVMDYFGEGSRLKHWEKRPGDPVSAADMAADAFLKDVLLTARPDYGWLSEESRAEPGASACTFVVDPIDGTRAFIKGRTDFCVSLAVVRAGVPVAAALFAPARGEFYSAVLGEGAQCNGEALRPSAQASISGARLLGDAGRLTDLRALGAETIHINSVALRLALTASGAADGLVAVRPKNDWDLAAGHLIVTEAGGRISSASGVVPSYDGPAHCQPAPIAAGPALHALLLERLARMTEESS
ncbi:MAG: inositol monophosphatase family protein [Caulobacterales bacterium]|uniref:inositol monophosphatase family protein n=1 Tax=Glycocaulis sp. TaxID=1969725 RepID=UPI003FA0F22E